MAYVISHNSGGTSASCCISSKTASALHGIKRDMLVYDPFMGIGNTALACIRLKVNYIGTEIDSQYIKVAQEQISGKIETYLQGDEDKLI
jgi:tRNA G10  N-methylase Trm11